MKIYEVEILGSGENANFLTTYVVAKDYHDVLNQLETRPEDYLYIKSIKFFAEVYKPKNA